MTLKYKVETVPEGLDEYYTASDEGGFVLDVDGIADNSTEINSLKAEIENQKKKVKEFRDHNVALRQQVESNSGTGDAPNIEALIEDAVSEMREKMNSTLAERDTFRNQLEEVVLSDNIKDIAIKHGVHETALSDVVSRAKHVFTVKDGKPVVQDKKSRDGNGELYTPDSWVKSLEESAPHLFKSSTGTGAQRPVGGGRGPDTRSSMQRIADGLNKPSSKNVM